MNYQSFIISLLLSGALGFINFSLLVNRGTFSAYTSKEDKGSMCIIFSIIDYSIFILLNARKLSFSHVIILTIIISFGFTMLFSFAYKLYYFFTNLFRKSCNLSSIVKETPREKAFSYGGAIYAFIFDFTHSFVSEGYIERYSDAKELENQLLLMPASDLREDPLTEKDCLKILKDALENKEAKKTNIYIDSDNKLKYFLIYYPKTQGDEPC